eukprot:gene5868-biopygen10505
MIPDSEFCTSWDDRGADTGLHVVPFSSSSNSKRQRCKHPGNARGNGRQGILGAFIPHRPPFSGTGRKVGRGMALCDEMCMYGGISVASYVRGRYRHGRCIAVVAMGTRYAGRQSARSYASAARDAPQKERRRERMLEKRAGSRSLQSAGGGEAVLAGLRRLDSRQDRGLPPDRLPRERRAAGMGGARRWAQPARSVGRRVGAKDLRGAPSEMGKPCR